MNRGTPPVSFSIRQAVCFSLLGAASSFAYIPIIQVSSFAVSVLATRYGFDLVTLGVVLMLVTVGDAIWDPLIGAASDRLKSPLGQRRPWIAVGVPLTVVSGLFLYYPRGDMTIMLFAACYAAFNLSASLFEVPYAAWATAATRDVQSRNRLYFVIPLIGWVANGLMLGMPLLPVFPTNELTLEVISLSLVLFALLALPATFLLFRHVPETAPVALRRRAPTEGWRRAVALLRENPPFRMLLLVNVVGGIGTSAGAGLFFFWFDSYLGLGEYVSMLGIAMMVPGILAPFAGLWLTRRFARNTVYVYASVAQALSGIVMLLLTPETPGLLYILLATSALFNGGLGTLIVTLTRAIYADVTDYGRLRAGIEGGGLYVSIASLVQKVQMTVFGGLGLIVVGLLGFQPGAEQQSDQALWALRTAVAGFPILFSVVAALLMLRFPLNARRMQIISRRLANLDSRGRGSGQNNLAAEPPSR